MYYTWNANWKKILNIFWHDMNQNKDMITQSQTVHPKFTTGNLVESSHTPISPTTLMITPNWPLRHIWITFIQLTIWWLCLSLSISLTHTNTRWLHRGEAWVSWGHVTRWTFINRDVYKEPRHGGTKEILNDLLLCVCWWSGKNSLSKHALAAGWHDFTIINRWSLSRKLPSPTHTHPPAHTHTHPHTPTGTGHARADELLTDAESGPNAILSSMGNPRVRKAF